MVSFIVFLIVAILTLLVGIICFIVWWRLHDSFKDTIKTIKDRLKEEKVDIPGDDESIGVTIKE